MKKFLQFLFSIKNKNKHKILCILGLKIKLKEISNIDQEVCNIAYNMPRLVQAFQKSIAIANLH